MILEAETYEKLWYRSGVSLLEKRVAFFLSWFSVFFCAMVKPAYLYKSVFISVVDYKHK